LQIYSEGEGREGEGDSSFLISGKIEIFVGKKIGLRIISDLLFSPSLTIKIW